MLFVEGLEEGCYAVRQTKVEEGYKLLNTVVMWVYHGQVASIDLANVMDIKPTPPAQEIKPPKEEEKPPEKDEDLPKEEIDEKDKVTNGEEKKKEEIVNEIKDETMKKGEQDIKADSSVKREVLPRTGNDYFLLKLILLDFCIFIIFLKRRPLYSKVSSLQSKF